MKELKEIVCAWDALSLENSEAVLATVVQVSGSTYRRPGARMLLTAEGRLAGSVSGGCLEGDILKKAVWRTRSGAALVTYDSTDEEDIVWGFGVGCNGVVQVLLERVSCESPGPLRLLQDVLRSRQPGVIATVISENGPAEVGTRLLLLPNGTTECTLTESGLRAKVETDARAALARGESRMELYPLATGAVAMFLEVVLPPAPLVIFGANHDAVPLVRLAAEIGWHITVVETRAVQARAERFPGADLVLACAPAEIADFVPLEPRTAAVVMTHNYPDDRRILRRLLDSSVGYIGQLGPRARTQRLLAEIADDGFEITAGHQGRLHGPVGLDLGADSPEEIALSVIAEIQAARAGRAGGFLRDRREPLHLHPTALFSANAQHRNRGSESACPLPV